MTAPADKAERLIALIDVACDGTLDEAAHSELDMLLRDDPAACRQYFAHYQLRSDIYLAVGARRAGAESSNSLAAALDVLDRTGHKATEQLDISMQTLATPEQLQKMTTEEIGILIPLLSKLVGQRVEDDST